ncbi:hypothetical protein [Kutzneria sp. CA-103260]|uniref:hypothetical protein n=1 Tax=Kutzneria sp. CA-103260 TaxID=2802641 RepID=UPI001BA7460A|nr:hypothetical protein [Kutzneria sp. CA-103260]QUQ70444.1 hypothetical protein JJ691_82230 [Kutzneria sp. CA-103260]
MLVFVDGLGGPPLVAELASPKATLTVEEISKHHVALLFQEGEAQFRLLLGTEVAALLTLRLTTLFGDRVAWMRRNGVER